MGQKVVDSVGVSFAGMRISYSREDSPLGTGGALAKACRLCASGHVFAMNGDTWLDLDYEKAEHSWLAHGGMLMGAVFKKDASRYGRLVLAEDKIVAITEKNAVGSGLINAGCYVVSPNILKHQIRQFSFEHEFLPQYLARSPAMPHLAEDAFWDIGIPEDYFAFCAWQKNAAPAAEPGA